MFRTRSILPDAKGLPLAVILTGANRHDVTQALPLVDAIPPVGGKPGRPRQRPESAYADRAYDREPLRAELRARGITPRIARRRQAHGRGLGVHRDATWPNRSRLGCLAAWLQAAAHPLRAHRLPARGLPCPRFLSDP